MEKEVAIEPDAVSVGDLEAQAPPRGRITYAPDNVERGHGPHRSKSSIGGVPPESRPQRGRGLELPPSGR